MKNTFLILLSLTLQFYCFSQDYDKRLLNTYSVDELSTLKKEQPENFKMLNYALDNALYILDLPKEKSAEISAAINYDFNTKPTFLALGLSIQKQNQYFKINGSNKMLVLKSEWVLMNELNTKK